MGQFIFSEALTHRTCCRTRSTITVPHELNYVILTNTRMMLNILFMAAAQALFIFGENALGGKPGFMASLHTWDQKLNVHFHLHCLVAGGVISKDGSC